MANDVFEAQAHFSTTPQSFSSSSDPKKQIIGISKYTFLQNTFSVRGTQGDSCQNGKNFFDSTTEVSYEPLTSTQLVLSANPLLGDSYKACSSIRKNGIGNQVFYNSTDFASHVRNLLPFWQ